MFHNLMGDLSVFILHTEYLTFIIILHLDFSAVLQYIHLKKLLACIVYMSVDVYLYAEQRSQFITSLQTKIKHIRIIKCYNHCCVI